MKTIYNNIIPFKGFKAITIYPFVFVRKSSKFTADDERHELIHCIQQKEMLAVGIVLMLALWVLGCGWWSLLALPIFFWWYLVEWLVRIVQYGSPHKAYRNISFEREAYAWEKNEYYLSLRTCFAWVKYIK